MAVTKSDPYSISWIKINPTGETISESEYNDQYKRAKQAVENQQFANRKNVAARPWRMMCICITLICVTAFILVNAAWLYAIYFPPRCVTRTESSSFKRGVPSNLLSNASFFEERFSLDSNEDNEDNEDNEVNQTETVQFVQRHEWLAEAPTLPIKKMAKLRLPVPYVFVTQTSTPNCFSLAECSSYARSIQHFQMYDKGWNDIIYHFLIGGDGRVYVGRGWNITGYDFRSIDVSFIGTYDTMPPSKVQLNTLQALIEYGVMIGTFSSDYKLIATRLLGLREVANNISAITPNPGEALYNVIKTLPHWSPDL